MTSCSFCNGHRHVWVCPEAGLGKTRLGVGNLDKKHCPVCTGDRFADLPSGYDEETRIPLKLKTFKIEED